MKSSRSEFCLRVALLLNASETQKWVGQVVEEVSSAGHRLAAVLLLPSSSVRPAKRLWPVMVDKIGRASCDPAPVTDIISSAPIVHLRSDEQGRVPQQQLEELASLKLDVILQPLSTTPQRALAGVAARGVWSFRYSDAPACDAAETHLANMLMDKITSELMLVRSTGENEAEEVLFRCRYALHPLSLRANLTRDAQRRRRILLRCLNGSLQPESIDRDVAAGAESPRINAKQVLRGTASLFAHSAAHLFRKRFYRSQWLIGCYDSSHRGPITLIRPPRGLNYGDPFLFARDGKSYVFFEVWKHGGKGTIYAAEIGTEGLRGQAQKILERPYHLSYPFVFEWSGEIYLMPESEQNKSLECYRAVDFPFRWEPASVSMSGVSAVDSTIVQHAGKFFLFTTGLAGPEAESAELSIFHSETPFGPWTPHPGNPVISDVRFARPAGAFFHHAGSLMRVSQDCSGTYGRAMELRRVDRLSETEFSESSVGRISADWMPNGRATHTLNQVGSLGVIDVRVEVPWFRLPFSGKPELPPILQKLCTQYEDTVHLEKTSSSVFSEQMHA